MKASAQGNWFTASEDQQATKLAQATATAVAKCRKQLLIAVGYSLWGIAFLGWLAWSVDVPARCWSMFCSPIEVTASDLELGEKPFQINWILRDYQSLPETGIPMFSEDDPKLQVGTLFPLVESGQVAQPKEAAQDFPKVFVVAGDSKERLKIEKDLQKGLAFECNCEPSIRNGSYMEELKAAYPNLDEGDLTFVSPGSQWTQTLTLFAVLMLLGLAYSGGIWHVWRNYALTNSFLEKGREPRKKVLHVGDWRQGSVVGASSVQTDSFPPLPAKKKLPSSLSVFLTILFVGLWLLGFFGMLWAFTIDVPWWGRALVVACSFALVVAARQMMAWGVEREPRRLDTPGSHSIESSIECHSFGKDLLALGFIDNCPNLSVQRKFFSCASGHVLAMTGFSRRDQCYYVTFLTFLEDGSVLQTSSSAKHLDSRSKYEPLWTVRSCNEVDTESVFHQHIQLVKSRENGNRLLVVTDKNVAQADSYLDQLSLQAMAKLWRKSIWKT